MGMAQGFNGYQIKWNDKLQIRIQIVIEGPPRFLRSMKSERACVPCPACACAPVQLTKWCKTERVQKTKLTKGKWNTNAKSNTNNKSNTNTTMYMWNKAAVGNMMWAGLSRGVIIISSLIIWYHSQPSCCKIQITARYMFPKKRRKDDQYPAHAALPPRQYSISASFFIIDNIVTMMVIFVATQIPNIFKIGVRMFVARSSNWLERVGWGTQLLMFVARKPTRHSTGGCDTSSLPLSDCQRWHQ